MATNYEDINVKCPFFKKIDNRKNVKRIRCEGITDTNSTLIDFERTKDMILHKEKYCDCKFKHCPLYKVLDKKYPE